MSLFWRNGLPFTYVLSRLINGSGPGGEEAALKAVGRKACGFESCRFRIHSATFACPAGGDYLNYRKPWN
jgi:hypothetical protein